MCVTFLLINDNAEDEWQMVMINNRDEEYGRPTEGAQWKDGVLCGRDLYPGKEGGTWLGVSQTGRVAVLLNIIPTVAPANQSELKGRGFLVRDFVQSDISPKDYGTKISDSAQSYSGFALVMLDKIYVDKNGVDEGHWRLAYYTNQDKEGVQDLPAGIYGFGNSPKSQPFVKVQWGLNLFQQTCHKHLFDPDVDGFVEDLTKILTDKRQCYPDEILTKYQSDKDQNGVKLMSSCFVEFPPPYCYGTRTHTILLIDGKGRATYIENNLDPVTKKWIPVKNEFTLKKRNSLKYSLL
jgi:uncharacterized protein with NRDE domain